MGRWGGFRRVAENLVPMEDDEQRNLMAWAEAQAIEPWWPKGVRLIHIPNEGRRSWKQGKRLKDMGLRRGVPDVFLPCARGGAFGLFIEMKRLAGVGSKPSKEQLEWQRVLREQGYAAEICRGADEAEAMIENYLKQRADS